MFWLVIAVPFLIIIVAAVIVGRTLSRPGSGQPLSRQEKMNALKASGAMPQRKESRR